MEIVVPDDFRPLYVVDDEHPILKVPDPRLRQKAQPVARVDRGIMDLGERMRRIMRQANGIGLAAPQIGIPKRVIVVAPPGMRPLVLVNPVITRSSTETEVAEEGCLSIPGLYGDVERPAVVDCSARDLKGRTIEFTAEGLAARVLQHEIDHLDGVLFVDRADPASLHWSIPDHAKRRAE